MHTEDARCANAKNRNSANDFLKICQNSKNEKYFELLSKFRFSSVLMAMGSCMEEKARERLQKERSEIQGKLKEVNDKIMKKMERADKIMEKVDEIMKRMDDTTASHQ